MPTSLLLAAVGWLVGWWLIGRPRGLPSASGAAPAVTIDVVIPARNEAAQLPRLLSALDRQTLRPALIVVVDDESDDDTVAVARAGGASVIAAGTTPSGWTGKSWACWQGARSGSSELLVFLDADTDPSPDLLRRLAAQQDRLGGLVSVQPFHRMVRWRERLAAVFNIIAVMGVGCGRSGRAGRRTVGAFGPCLACCRVDYLDVGGHQSIAASVIDDFALAQQFRSHGKPTDGCVGRGAIEFRMYPSGTRALVEGFSKNFASGAGKIPRARTVAIALWITALLSAVLMLGDALTGGPVVGAVVFGLAVLQMHLFLRPLGNFGVASAVLYPLSLVAFVGIFAWSLVSLVRGDVRWKGRTVQLRGEPG
jgi:4,4'-diaponeurosporenoate glycosyltransferase